MVTSTKQHSEKTPVKQGSAKGSPEPNKINASTPYDFTGKNLTPYGGLLPVITLLEKLGFQARWWNRPSPRNESPAPGTCTGSC
jgi:hypothetical protein